MKTTPILRTFSVFFLPYAIVLTVSYGLFLWQEHNHHLKSIIANESIQIDLAKKSLVRDFESVLPDLNVLSNEQHMQSYLNDRTEASRQLLIDELKSFLLQKRIYLLAHILDIHGKETVRLDFRNNQVIVIPEDKLQEKNHRYYFQPSVDLGLGELYISPIDLNVEYKMIEIPHIPVIRFGTPLFDNSGRKCGVLILNYLAENMLRHFDEMLSTSSGHIALVNHESYWIRSHIREREWGFQLGSDLQFKTNHPTAWEHIKQHDAGTIQIDDGLFTYTTIYPIELIGGYSPYEVENEHNGHHHIDPKSYSWKIISDVPGYVIYSKLKQLILGPVGFTWLLLISLGAIIARILGMNYLEKQRLQEQNALHARIFESSTDGIMITNDKAQIIAINDTFSQITGYQNHEVIGKNPNILSSGLQDKAFYNSMWTSLNKQGYWAGEIYNRHKDGKIFAEWLRISAIKNEQGKNHHYVAILTDITQKKLQEEQLQKRAHHDALTGLHNRHAFEEILQSTISHAELNQLELALLYIDLDSFKPINDRYGHEAGDAVLKTIASRIHNGVRGIDTVSRIGGDEFTIILIDIKSRENAQHISQVLQASLREPISFKNMLLKIDSSIGIAIYPDDAQNPEDLVKIADNAMYQNKQQHKVQATHNI